MNEHEPEAEVEFDMPTITRIRNKTSCLRVFDFGDDKVIYLPGRDKKNPEVNISRPITFEEQQALDVQVNLKSGDIDLVVDEIE